MNSKLRRALRKMTSFVFHSFEKYKTIKLSKFKTNPEILGSFIIAKLSQK